MEVENPSEYMLSGKPENASGSVVACAMEGTRPMLMEIQALVCKTNFGMPRRTAAGLVITESIFCGSSGKTYGNAAFRV